MKVDSHHHFWNPELRDYYWMEGAAFDSIRRPFGPEDLRPSLQRAEIDKTILSKPTEHGRNAESFSRLPKRPISLAA